MWFVWHSAAPPLCSGIETTLLGGDPGGGLTPVIVVQPRNATDRPLTVITAGAHAWASVRPPPKWSRPARSSEVIVWSTPGSRASYRWLFARSTTSTPARRRAEAAASELAMTSILVGWNLAGLGRVVSK